MFLHHKVVFGTCRVLHDMVTQVGSVVEGTKVTHTLLVSDLLCTIAILFIFWRN